MADEIQTIGPICPFCSATWSERNVRVWDVDSADQCASGRFEPPMKLTGKRREAYLSWKEKQYDR